MRVFILKDGTIPVAVVTAIAEDAGTDWKQYADELADSGAHEYVEMFEVEDSSAYLAVSWDDVMGFQAIGYSTLDDALDWLNEDATPEAIAGSNLGDGHWALAYGQGDDETYGHVFTVPVALTLRAPKGR